MRLPKFSLNFSNPSICIFDRICYNVFIMLYLFITEIRTTNVDVTEKLHETVFLKLSLFSERVETKK